MSESAPEQLSWMGESEGRHEKICSKLSNLPNWLILFFLNHNLFSFSFFPTSNFFIHWEENLKF